MRGIGSWWEAAGEAARGNIEQGKGETPIDSRWARPIESCSCRRLKVHPSVQGFTKATTALQVAQHGLGQHAHRLGVIRPFELLAAVIQVLQRIFEPEQIGVPLAHEHTC